MKHSYTIQLSGIRLIPLTAESSEKYRLLRNRDDIGKWFTYKDKISSEQQINWFKRYEENPSDIMFSIIDTDENFIGCNSIYNIDWKAGKAEYGRLIVDPVCAGKGYGALATKMAVFIAREKLKLNELYLEVYIENIPAINAYHKAGFKDNGNIFDHSGKSMISMNIRL